MAQNKRTSSFQNQIIAHYHFDDQNEIGKDSSGRGNDATAEGTSKPTIETVGGRTALSFAGGKNGSSYMKLPEHLLNCISDYTGLTVSTWVYFKKGTNVWERIFDFGKGATGPYLFLSRNVRGVCFSESDIVADAGRTYSSGEWIHVAMSVTGTKGGTLSSAGPIIYVNGEVIADGSISQTSSGTYKRLRQWFDTFSEPEVYCNNYIGRSQHEVDPDFNGSLTDFRVYGVGLTEDEIIEVMCESLTDKEITALAKDKYLSFPLTVVTKDVSLPMSLMGGKVTVSWESSDQSSLSNDGKIGEVQSPKAVTLSAKLRKGEDVAEKQFSVTVLPKGLPSHTLTIDGKKELVDVSDTFYGLFYEDINNAADGGIYAELVQNRSFESFAFDTYSHQSGECGCSTGRNHEPLHAWFGDVDNVTVHNSGGLNEHFGITDKDVNSHYITVQAGSTIINKGYTDSNHHCAMSITKRDAYDFTIWAKAEHASRIHVQLQNEEGSAISDAIMVNIEGGGTWKKYGIDKKIVLTGTETALGQLALTFDGDISIDMVSLFPQDVWGANEEEESNTAHANYKGNPNYRLRKDLVKALVDLHPTFLRFPGGCISEGSYIWDNVYEWKDSVGAIELRKENFNVWGYMMTMGLGYMEYFQLAEDLNATPLPVMACGVLCQARSDYVHPAGGELRDYYVKSFTDLIDFAISTDVELNEWARLRKEMGHEAPFPLHYLGMGNENWGTEFFANFEYFKAKIDAYMEKNYPGYELHIISTVGAQADDDAYQEGWKFLSGNLTGTATVNFTDGKTVTKETVSWYEKQPNYMDTIADEHYYRSNEYLLNNADRYNYYYRAYQADGSLDERETSKVFVGEYASTDKNTLAGAIAEAAIMTGFEKNADVVRLTAYAPLFNKVLTDGTYRWTPDLIWFDDETVWFTPNYYVQQLFARYIGRKVLGTSFSTYRKGELTNLKPRGGIEIAAGNGELHVKDVKVIDNITGKLLFNQDFTKELHPEWQVIPGSKGYKLDAEKGLVLEAQNGGLNGLYLLNPAWSNYKVEVTATKVSGDDGFYIGVGLTDISAEKKDVIEYAVGYNGTATGVKVYKDGVQGYMLGDYSSSTAAGNLRSSCLEEVIEGTPYTISVHYGGDAGDRLICSYTDGEFSSKVLDYKLEAYNSDIFNSVTSDDDAIYAKLVNADPFEKTVKLSLKDVKVVKQAKMIVVTGDESLVHVPNVNKKNAEQVVPVEKEIELNDNSATITLAANSVNVIVVNKKI
ncbi:alpha-L-arabinofuranosidase C-terminal domain-containing protein [Alkalihalobacillus sp. LMS39]|uniref:alpha-L-arabinofuranosidase C-terminal domain-containing protein n=1 Tax=Alkalihalobacillus sp. LMS39 TaxID=2924032 RepID=UPI001FB3C83C|nr:alpha-L-arabinofuranosidase C-terminal domain-containing protein [Alkalihalobacillus sp. LMS39]UOE92687.1 alpha-L-arabinofuranosidase [Alkalihalobacillus sp. LMS39]